jgi:hypothetical protein
LEDTAEKLLVDFHLRYPKQARDSRVHV